MADGGGLAWPLEVQGLPAKRSGVNPQRVKRRGVPLRVSGRHPEDKERGAGTVLMVGFALALLILVAGVVLLMQGAVSASRAATAADLSVLAAADAARGLREGEPCVLALEVAEKQGARLETCAAEGSTGDIYVVTTTVTAGGLLPPATGAARAGPPP
ncbi:secretion/DNA translocation related TadE-like protein [Arthrobacter sp. CAN_A214]|uniref:Rv3654c family TadE-like protein n=1 Tax=Arthrobacter sp. CAN_A214 TaxID=2787720 RepID=UPI0018CB8BE3